MAKMSIGTLKALLASEKADALASMTASRLSEDRAIALDYYHGEVPDMPAAQGRSSAVSTDVMDTINGLMPQIMEIFCSGDEVVRFEPVGPEDEEAAAQETDYVNHVFMQQNPGFMILDTFFMDAFLSKVGVVKVYWKVEEKEEKQTYYNLDDAQFAVYANDAMNGELEIIEHTAKDQPGDDDDVERGSRGTKGAKGNEKKSSY